MQIGSCIGNGVCIIIFYVPKSFWFLGSVVGFWFEFAAVAVAVCCRSDEISFVFVLFKASFEVLVWLGLVYQLADWCFEYQFYWCVVKFVLVKNLLFIKKRKSKQEDHNIFTRIKDPPALVLSWLINSHHT